MLQSLRDSSNTPSADVPSPRTGSHKREASPGSGSCEPPAHRVRMHEEESHTDEVLLTIPEDEPLESPTYETYMAAFLQKKMQKEFAPTGHPPELQQKIDLAKETEWETLVSKDAVKVWTGEAARKIKREQSHRFIGSRFVIAQKTDEEGVRMKARLCLQGHRDPDFHEKINAGCFNSPTMSQLARTLVLQILVSRRWVLKSR